MKLRCVFSFRRNLRRREFLVDNCVSVDEAFSKFYAYLRDEGFVFEVIPLCWAELSIPFLKVSIFNVRDI